MDETLKCERLKSRRAWRSTSGGWNIKRDWQLYVMLLIPVVYIVIFKYIPMYGVLIAFKDFNIFQGIFKSEWVGTEMFQQLWTMQDFRRAFRNTLMLNVLDLAVGFPVPVFLALCLNELKNLKFKKISQTLLYLPYFMSWVIIGGIVYQLFSTNTGMVNQIIKAAGGEVVPFLTNKWYWVITYLFSGIWRSAGWNTSIYMAAITGVDASLYEAAEVDGAGRIRKMISITLPSIKPTIVIMLIMQVGQMMTIGFERPYVMGNNLVMDFSDVLSTFVYRLGLQNGKFSLSTAAGFFQSVVGLILISSANLISEKMGQRGIW